MVCGILIAMKNSGLNKKGFTLIEITIVLLIFSVIVAIAVLNFMAERKRTLGSTCLINMGELQTGLDRASFEENKDVSNLSNDVVIKAIVYPTYLKSMPDCPLGNYSTNENGDIQCSYHSGE